MFTKLRRRVAAKLEFREVEGKNPVEFHPTVFYIGQEVEQFAKKSSAVCVPGGFQDPTVKSQSDLRADPALSGRLD